MAYPRGFQRKCQSTILLSNRSAWQNTRLGRWGQRRNTVKLSKVLRNVGRSESGFVKIFKSLDPDEVKWWGWDPTRSDFQAN